MPPFLRWYSFLFRSTPFLKTFSTNLFFEAASIPDANFSVQSEAEYIVDSRMYLLLYTFLP